MIPTEDIISIVKNTIAASIKCNTHRGYIGWSSCDNICMDMHDCLDMCAETLEKRGYMAALEAAAYILVSGVKLASHADSSSGMLTDVIMCTYELIDKCTKEIEKKDKQMRDQALALIIREAKKSVFDGWTDWRYNLLKSGICLCDEKSAKKLEKVLDTLLEISREDYFPEYTKKEDLTVRFAFPCCLLSYICRIAYYSNLPDHHYDNAIYFLHLPSLNKASLLHHNPSLP